MEPVADLGGGIQQINLQVPPERILVQMSTVRVAQNGSFGKVDNVNYPGVGGFFSDDQGNAVALYLADGTALPPAGPALTKSSFKYLTD